MAERPKKKRRGTPRKPPNPIKPGEVRNPKGINGWTKARERIRQLLAESGEDLFEVAKRIALTGDDKALKLLLGPLLPAQEVKVEAEGAITVRFAREDEAPKEKADDRPQGAR